MGILFLIVFFFVSFLIVGLVLLQEGKGGGLTGMSTGMDGVMGAKNPLRRMTAYLFVVFVLMAVSINWYFHDRSRSESTLPAGAVLPVSNVRTLETTPPAAPVENVTPPIAAPAEPVESVAPPAAPAPEAATEPVAPAAPATPAAPAEQSAPAAPAAPVENVTPPATPAPAAEAEALRPVAAPAPVATAPAAPAEPPAPVETPDAEPAVTE